MNEDDEGRMVEREDEVLEVMAKHWDLGRERDDNEAELGDVSG